jgi:hypothetical protein
MALYHSVPPKDLEIKVHPTMALYHLAPPNGMEIKANGVHPLKAAAANLLQYQVLKK